MNLFSLVIKSFRHYLPAHLTVAAGIAIITAIITGGLIVGDSVTHSLLETARYRTGNISYMVGAGDRIFTRDLATGMAEGENFKTTPVLRLGGIAVSDGGGKRLNKIQVWGLESGFNQVAGMMPGLDSLDAGECIISENLALRLDLEVGDQFLLRIRKASEVPANAPFVSDKVQTVSARIVVKKLAGRNEMGRLNMQVSQTAPYNVFLSLDWTNHLLDLENACNLVLVSGEQITTLKLEQSVQENWTSKDVSLDIDFIKETQDWKISSRRVFIDAPTSKHIRSVLPEAEPVLTYFANSISSGGSSNPYSFVSTLASAGLKENEIIVNEWLGDDLGIGEGDSVSLKYFVIGPLRNLQEAEKQFIVQRVVPIQGRFGDRELAPFIPGLSDAGSCSEWETGVPVDLESIRDKDEEYWNNYKGTPKAFISLETAEQLWQNRFGLYTSFRIPDMQEINNAEGNDFKNELEKIQQFEKTLVAGLLPADIGFEAVALKDEAVYAAVNGVDFSQLFIGLSFFILVSGIILTILLLSYNIMQRSSQNGTLSALGFSARKILKMVMMENILVAISGTFIGVFLAVLYTRLVFSGLNRVWFDIVRTNVLEVQILPGTLVMGMLVSLLTSLITMFIYTRKLLGNKVAEIQKGVEKTNKKKGEIYLWISAIGLCLLSLILAGIQFFSQQVLNPGSFFLAGGMLLVSILLFSAVIFRRMNRKDTLRITIPSLRKRNLAFNRARSMTIIILLAIGTYLVISTGANKKSFTFQSHNKTSGTGGYLFYAESTVPLLSDLNKESNRIEQGLMEQFSLVQFRVNEGDDASCLNLNRISNPRIIASDPERLANRFTFATSTEYIDPDSPWKSLDLEIPGLVPAIADQTVIQWGLGKKVGDTLDYIDELGEPMRLLLVGGLAPSIFQGSVIISEKQFLSHFPSSSGSKVFLIDGDPANTEAISADLRATFRDHGWEMTFTEQRLAEFNSVSNTYLSIFLILGTFGLILGTIGLAIVLVQNIRERRMEIALMTAAGFSRQKIRGIISTEYIILMLIGIMGGFITAVLSTLPVFLSSHSDVSFLFIAGLTGIILINGLIWIWVLSSYHIRRLKITEDLRNE